MSIGTMPKGKKTTGAKGKLPKGQVPPEKVEPVPAHRRTVLTIKGTDAWRVWLERLSKHVRTPTSTIVDHALVDYAKKVGFDEEAPER